MLLLSLISSDPPVTLSKTNERTNPNNIGTITPNEVMITDCTPTALTFLISVPRPAENMMRMTPIFAKISSPESV